MSVCIWEENAPGWDAAALTNKTATRTDSGALRIIFTNAVSQLSARERTRDSWISRGNSSRARHSSGAGGDFSRTTKMLPGPACNPAHMSLDSGFVLSQRLFIEEPREILVFFFRLERELRARLCLGSGWGKHELAPHSFLCRESIVFSPETHLQGVVSLQLGHWLGLGGCRGWPGWLPGLKVIASRHRRGGFLSWLSWLHILDMIWMMAGGISGLLGEMCLPRPCCEYRYWSERTKEKLQSALLSETARQPTAWTERA